MLFFTASMVGESPLLRDYNAKLIFLSALLFQDERCYANVKSPYNELQT